MNLKPTAKNRRCLDDLNTMARIVNKMVKEGVQFKLLSEPVSSSTVIPIKQQTEKEKDKDKEKERKVTKNENIYWFSEDEYFVRIKNFPFNSTLIDIKDCFGQILLLDEVIKLNSF